MSVLGAGMLSVPYTFTLVPVPVAIALIFLVGCTMSYTATLLLRCFESTGLLTCEHLALQALGPVATQGSCILIALAIYGACTGSLMILRDVVPSIMTLLLPIHAAETLGPTGFQLILLTAILLPLCLRRQLSALRFSCFLGFAFTLYLVSVMFIRASVTSDRVPEPVARPPAIVGWTRVISIYSFAFVMHLNVLPLLHELNGTAIKTISMKRVIHMTGLICILLYVCFGASAYHLYGSETQGNVLLNLRQDFTMQIPRVAVFITVLASFPMLFHPLRAILEGLCEIRSKTSKIVFVILLLASQVAITWTASSIVVVFTLTGATTIVGMCYVLPCVFFLQLVPSASTTERLGAVAIVLSSTTIGCIATILTLFPSFGSIS